MLASREYVTVLTMERRRQVLTAVVSAMVINVLIIWFLWGRSMYQLPPPPPNRIEVNLITPRPPSVPKPPVMPPPPPRVVPPTLRPTPVEQTPEPAKVAEPTPPVPEPVTAPAPVAPEPIPEPVVGPRFDVAYLNNPKPTYPFAARRMGLQGTVILRVRVNPAGKPEHVQVITSAGSPMLDEAAVAVVTQHWTFVPARQGDRAVSGTVDVPIRFSLN